VHWAACSCSAAGRRRTLFLTVLLRGRRAISVLSWVAIRVSTGPILFAANGHALPSQKIRVLALLHHGCRGRLSVGRGGGSTVGLEFQRSGCRIRRGASGVKAAITAGIVEAFGDDPLHGNKAVLLGEFPGRIAHWRDRPPRARLRRAIECPAGMACWRSNVTVAIWRKADFGLETRHCKTTKKKAAHAQFWFGGVTEMLHRGVADRGWAQTAPEVCAPSRSR